MTQYSFSGIADKYAKDSLVQKPAGRILLDLLDIQSDEDILDLGCGPGHLTKEIRQLTKGIITGTDISDKMIDEAKKNYQGLDIQFRIESADLLNEKEKYDVIYCNSVFQWWKNPNPGLKACYRALKKNGRMGIQAPASENYSPQFIRAIKEIAHHPKTGKIFTHFKSPWLLLESEENYKTLFESVGFKVTHAKIHQVKTVYTVEETYRAFHSGAATGYLNQDHYGIPLTDDYIETFQTIIQDSFQKQADQDGKLELVFHRIYLLAIKG